MLSAGVPIREQNAPETGVENMMNGETGEPEVLWRRTPDAVPTPQTPEAPAPVAAPPAVKDDPRLSAALSAGGRVANPMAKKADIPNAVAAAPVARQGSVTPQANTSRFASTSAYNRAVDAKAVAIRADMRKRGYKPLPMGDAKVYARKAIGDAPPKTPGDLSKALGGLANSISRQNDIAAAARAKQTGKKQGTVIVEMMEGASKAALAGVKEIGKPNSLNRSLEGLY